MVAMCTFVLARASSKATCNEVGDPGSAAKAAWDGLPWIQALVRHKKRTGFKLPQLLLTITQFQPIYTFQTYTRDWPYNMLSTHDLRCVFARDLK